MTVDLQIQIGLYTSSAHLQIELGAAKFASAYTPESGFKDSGHLERNTAASRPTEHYHARDQAPPNGMPVSEIYIWC